MIYYLIFFAAGIFMDFKDLKESDNKSDIVVYIVLMLIAFALAIYHYLNIDSTGISEYIIQLMGVK